MIGRIWRGRVRRGMLAEYCDYVASTGLRDYRATPGNRGAYILTREREDEGEIVTLSFSESIEAFAGKDVTLARYYPADERFLLDFPTHVDHYDVKA